MRSRRHRRACHQVVLPAPRRTRQRIDRLPWRVTVTDALRSRPAHRRRPPGDREGRVGILITNPDI